MGMADENRGTMEPPNLLSGIALGCMGMVDGNRGTMETPN